MNFFITGGAGFIGSNFVEFLFKHYPLTKRVTVFDKFTYASSPNNLLSYVDNKKLKIIKGDICNYRKLDKAMRDHNIVIHFAAESHVDRSIKDASNFIKTNLIGTHNVLESSLKNKIKTVIHISTDEVYGSIEKGSANETDILKPNSPYAASKAGSDLISRSYYKTYGLDVRITRSCNNFGKHQFPEKVIPVFINAIQKKLRLPIYGTGHNTREWIHVLDNCRAILKVIELGKPGEIYNIGSGYSISNLELAEKIIKIMQAPKDSLMFVTDRLGHDFRYSINSSKINSMGFKCIENFQNSLEATIEWYIRNPDWFNRRIISK